MGGEAKGAAGNSQNAQLSLVQKQNGFALRKLDSDKVLLFLSTCLLPFPSAIKAVNLLKRAQKHQHLCMWYG